MGMNDGRDSGENVRDARSSEEKATFSALDGYKCHALRVLSPHRRCLCLRGEDTASVRPAAPSVCSAAGALRPAGRWHVNAWCTSFGVIISDASLTHTVPQRSMPTLQSTVVLSSTMAIDQRSARWQGTRRDRQYLGLKSEDAGFEINAVISLYNCALTGFDRHDALVLPQQQRLPEDVLR